jgi:negative regulator of flagellin synthesis FlgM
MKIDSNKDLAQSQIQNAGKGRETGNAVPASSSRIAQDQNPASSTADRVDLSDTALKLSQLDTAPAADNSGRIAELKAAIENGSYEIDPSRVADKLIEIEGLE